MGGATLPPPEKDNLTIRIIIDIYDWLGFLYQRLQENARAAICFSFYEEFALNLIKFDITL
jgi:hypothetical protein